MVCKRVEKNQIKQDKYKTVWMLHPPLHNLTPMHLRLFSGDRWYKESNLHSWGAAVWQQPAWLQMKVSSELLWLQPPYSTRSRSSKDSALKTPPTPSREDWSQHCWGRPNTSSLEGMMKPPHGTHPSPATSAVATAAPCQTVVRPLNTLLLHVGHTSGSTDAAKSCGFCCSSLTTVAQCF